MKNLFSTLLVSCALTVAAFAQTPTPTATPPVANAGEDDVVKISTALIQLDVVVTDKNGKLVTDLKLEDFEITENGERQEITNLAYFSGRQIAPSAANLNAVGGVVGQTMPAIGEVRRTVAVVIDDAGLSAQSIAAVKKQLSRFISEEVQPNDLIAVIKTSGSVGILQQFTIDKRKILAAIDNLKFQPLTSGGLSAFAPISISFADQIRANRGGASLTEKAQSIVERQTDLEALADINKNIVITAGALGVLNSTINAMSRLPGRKSVLYVADGVFSLLNQGPDGIAGSINQMGGTASIFTESRELEDKLRGITEIANRATIAIYTLDPRGAQTVALSAEDSTRGGMFSSMTREEIDTDLSRKNDSFKASQQGLKFLSAETSGRAFINTNDLGKSLRETLDSQNGYYIVAYQPDNETFDAEKRRFNKLAVKVKRPNLNVSYRSGFFNVAETNEEKIAAAPERVFLQKLFSPYKHSDVDLSIASIYAADEQATTVRAFIGIEPRDLQFKDAADGDKQAQFDVFAVAFDENGIPISQVGKRFDIKISPASYETLLQSGIASSLSFATRAKGAQQIKVAVRDVNTNKIGTAAQIIEIPNFDKESIGLSGILLQNHTMQDWQAAQSGKANPTDAAARMQAHTARRRFKKGTVLSFNYAVYTAASLRSKSTAQFTVFKDGKEVFKGAPEQLNIAAAAGNNNNKMQRVNGGGAFLLGTEMTAGRYVLQVAVGGDAVKETEIRQIDFELVN